MKVTAIVPAAGAGSRITKKKGRRKPFFILNNKPILIHTLLALEGSRCIDDIIVVVNKNYIAKCKAIVKRYGLKKVDKIISGGETRFESVKEGLAFIAGNSDVVFIHDGVRPLINEKIISDSIKACKRFGAAVCGIPVVSTVKFINNNLTVKATPDRRRLYMVQTPQVFKRHIILRAYKTHNRPRRLITDDSMLVEKLGYKVKIIPGSYENIKVTTAQDMILAESLLKRR